VGALAIGRAVPSVSPGGLVVIRVLIPLLLFAHKIHQIAHGS